VSDDDGLMARFGLARCSRCRRIVLERRLRAGKCRDNTECILSKQLAWYAEREQPAEPAEESDGKG